MKRVASCFLCFIVVLSFAGCNASKTKEKLTSGTYYMDGDFTEGSTPYVYLSVENGGFSMGAGSVFSFVAIGSYTIKEDTLVATTQIATFVFKIEDSKTLLLIDNGDNEYFQLAENSYFIYSNNFQ